MHEYTTTQKYNMTTGLVVCNGLDVGLAIARSLVPLPVGVAITWTADCLRTAKPSRYKTNTKVNSAFHPSGVSKLGIYRPVWLDLRRDALTCVGWKITLCDPIRQVTLRSLNMGFP